MNKQSVAIVHDYLVDRGGAERVVIDMANAYPEAPIYTALFNPNKTFTFFAKNSGRIKSSKLLNFLLLFVRKREALAPLIMLYFRLLNLRKYKVILSSSSAFAINVKHNNHICYCHTPARFIWRNSDYNLTNNRFYQLLLNSISALFKPFDWRAAQRITLFIANSQNIKKRIELSYGKQAEVLFPAIDTKNFKPQNKREGFFLIVSRLKKYKNVDLAIKAFNQLGLPLYVVGGGSQERYLRSIAGDNIKFLGRVSDQTIKKLYAECRAFIFPGEEDFGITPLEAMASGAPVIAFGKGGALETITDSVGGLFFYKQNVSALKKAVLTFTKNQEAGFTPAKVAKSVKRFDVSFFYKSIQSIMDRY